ncbi:MAG: aminotransferase class I/II-fold pyridoxal phosphate-dependent enzyme, partial [candidate division KSB1 bacterium]|nr:aminotransferase class I/II-fold pyridoxal phosphate-dependent enzyme [candidate division KSB1 bacterium]
RRVHPSGIRKIFEIACSQPGLINLSIGEPDFDVPLPVKKEAIKWINRGYNKYTPTRGIPELREKVRSVLSARGVEAEEVLITTGATGGLLLAMMALVDEGDEVLIPDPYFVAYCNVVRLLGATPRLVDTYPDFRLRESAFTAHISERTKAIIVNTPHNPTGVVYTREELELVARIARTHGLAVVSDEVYDRFVYGETRFTSMAEVLPDAIVVNGFSKTGGMTGWRVGYAIGPGPVIEAMAMFQQYSYVCANSAAQKAALVALDVDLSEHVQRCQRKRDLAYEELRKHFWVQRPDGAFYIFPQAPDGDGDAFVHRAIEQGVLVVPGGEFSARRTHFRVSFAVPEEALRKALAIFARMT